MPQIANRYTKTKSSSAKLEMARSALIITCSSTRSVRHPRASLNTRSSRSTRRAVAGALLPSPPEPGGSRSDGGDTAMSTMEAATMTASSTLRASDRYRRRPAPVSDNANSSVKMIVRQKFMSCSAAASASGIS
jgi:hypothetical protein